MLRLLMGLLMLSAMLAAPVHAQKKRPPAEPSAEEVAQKRDAEALDRQYNSTLKRTSQDVAPVRVDPWANVRGTESTKR